MKKAEKDNSLIWACLSLIVGGIGYIYFKQVFFLFGGIAVFALIFTN
nr:hypothetical protein [Tissierella sp.]